MRVSSCEREREREQRDIPGGTEERRKTRREREREERKGEGIAGRLVKWGPHGYVSEVTHVSSTFQTIRERACREFFDSWSAIFSVASRVHICDNYSLHDTIFLVKTINNLCAQDESLMANERTKCILVEKKTIFDSLKPNLVIKTRNSISCN